MTTTFEGVRLGEIGQIAIAVKDVEAATAFYRDKLGWRFLFDAGGLVFFDCGGVRIMVEHPPKPEFDHPASILYFRVADIEQAYADLRGRGVEFIDEPHIINEAPDHTLWMAFFRDLDENVFGIMSEVPKAP